VIELACSRSDQRGGKTLGHRLVVRGRFAEPQRALPSGNFRGVAGRPEPEVEHAFGFGRHDGSG
jgi:hypothetical protein